MRKEKRAQRSFLVVSFFSFVLASSLLPSEARAQWAKTYGYWTQLNKMKQTSDRGYVVASQFGGQPNDISVWKLSSEGNVEWYESFGGSNYEKPSSIELTTDGGYLVAGDTNSFGAGNYDLLLFKLNSSGVLQWARTYGNTGGDMLGSAQEIVGGGYIVTGNLSLPGSTHILVLKLSSTGIIQWRKTYGAPEISGSGEGGKEILQTFDNGFIIAGGRIHDFPDYHEDILVVKTDGNGVVQWAKNIGGSGDDFGYVIRQTSDSGYIIGGWTDSAGAGNEDFLVLKLSSTGTVQWAKTIGGAAMDKLSSIEQTADGGYIIGGYCASSDAGAGTGVLLKMSSAGNVQWAKAFGEGLGPESVDTVLERSEGGFAVVGYYSTCSYCVESYVLELEPDGDMPDCSLLQDLNLTAQNMSLSATTVTITVETASVIVGAPLLTIADESVTDTILCVGCIDEDDDGYACNSGCGTLVDCDCDNPDVNPGAMEECDRIDNDCDGVADEGFDQDGDGWTTCRNDCDDGDPEVNPGGIEGPYGDPICSDEKDNDCDLLVDEDDWGCQEHPGSCAGVASGSTLGMPTEYASWDVVKGLTWLLPSLGGVIGLMILRWKSNTLNIGDFQILSRKLICFRRFRSFRRSDQVNPQEFQV